MTRTEIDLECSEILSGISHHVDRSFVASFLHPDLADEELELRLKIVQECWNNQRNPDELEANMLKLYDLYASGKSTGLGIDRETGIPDSEMMRIFKKLGKTGIVTEEDKIFMLVTGIEILRRNFDLLDTMRG